MVLIDWSFRITCSTLKFDEKTINDWLAWHGSQNCILSDKNSTSGSFTSFLVIIFSPCFKFIISLIPERDVPIPWFNSSVIDWSSSWNNKRLFETFGIPYQLFLQLHVFFLQFFSHVFVNKLNETNSSLIQESNEIKIDLSYSRCQKKDVPIHWFDSLVIDLNPSWSKNVFSILLGNTIDSYLSANYQLAVRSYQHLSLQFQFSTGKQGFFPENKWPWHDYGQKQPPEVLYRKRCS